MLSRRADVAVLPHPEELAKRASRRMDATQAMTTGHVAAATVIAGEVRTRAALFLPLPLAGEVAALVRARRVGGISPRILARVMWRRPHPNPPRQAGEGAQSLAIPAASARPRSARGAVPGTAAAPVFRRAFPSARRSRSRARRWRLRTGRRSAPGKKKRAKRN